jgi:hypothetical protein
LGEEGGDEAKRDDGEPGGLWSEPSLVLIERRLEEPEDLTVPEVDEVLRRLSQAI